MGFVDDLTYQLEKAGFDIWLDYRNLVPGMPWATQIDKGLNEADLILLVVAKESIASPYVELEWRHALEHNKRVVLALFEAVALPPELQTLEWVDFRGGYKSALRDLISRLNSPQPNEQPAPQSGFRAPFVILLTTALALLSGVVSLFSFYIVLLPWVLVPFAWRVLKRNFDYAQAQTALWLLPIGSLFGGAVLESSMIIDDNVDTIFTRVVYMQFFSSIPLSIALLLLLRSSALQRWGRPEANAPKFANPYKPNNPNPRPVRFYIDHAPQDRVIDANTHTSTTVYDDLNRPESFTDANGNTTTNGYDPAGNVIASTDALGKSSVTMYNLLNQPIILRDALGNQTTNAYNLRGELISTTDAEGVTTAYEHDALGRLTAVVENYKPANQPDHQTNVRTKYTYDENGNRLSIQDGDGHITSFTYDNLNRLISETDPLQHTSTYGYDFAGNRISMTDPKGATTIYTYDDANRLTDIVYPDSTVHFTYDDGGRRTAMTDLTGTTHWIYNELNQVISVTDPFNKMVGYDYDSIGNRVSLTYPDGHSVSYAYDPGNRLTAVNGPSSVVDYSYDDANRLTNITRPNNVTTAYTYDNANRLLDITHAQGQELLSSFQYLYDKVGNRTQAIENISPPSLTAAAATMPVAALPNTFGLPPSNLDAANLYLSSESSTSSNSLLASNNSALPVAYHNAAAPQVSAQEEINFNRLPLSFIANIGQFDKDVKFQTNSLGGSIFFTESEVVLALMDQKGVKLKDNEGKSQPAGEAKVVRIKYKNAEKNPLVEGLDLLPGVANFMVGSDKKAWTADAPMYDGIIYRNLYAGIDLHYEGAGHSLKSTFTVAAGADPAII